MGMFDYVVVEHWPESGLPDGMIRECSETPDQYMSRYRITADRRLVDAAGQLVVMRAYIRLAPLSNDAAYRYRDWLAHVRDGQVLELDPLPLEEWAQARLAREAGEMTP
jgi:hypothetical protein